MDQNLVRRWYELAPECVRRGTLVKSSVDSFARYIIAEQEYLRAVQHVLRALRTGSTSEAAAWSQIQDRFFRELQSSGRLFGLSPDADIL